MSETEVITTSAAISAASNTAPQSGFILLPCEQIAALRSAREETLEAFGKLVGVGSKGRMSEIERGVQIPTPEQALAIEALSNGAINASGLNPIVARARAIEWQGQVQGGVHAPTDSADVAATSPGKCGDDFPAGEPHQAEAAA